MGGRGRRRGAKESNQSVQEGCREEDPEEDPCQGQVSLQGEVPNQEGRDQLQEEDACQARQVACQDAKEVRCQEDRVSTKDQVQDPLRQEEIRMRSRGVRTISLHEKTFCSDPLDTLSGACASPPPPACKPVLCCSKAK